jgi:hypothetical protein
LDLERNKGACNVPTSIVDDLFDYSANVTVAFCEIEITQTGRLFVVMGMGFELEDKLILSVFSVSLELETYDGM